MGLAQAGAGRLETPSAGGGGGQAGLQGLPG